MRIAFYSAVLGLIAGIYMAPTTAHATEQSNSVFGEGITLAQSALPPVRQERRNIRRGRDVERQSSRQRRDINNQKRRVGRRATRINRNAERNNIRASRQGERNRSRQERRARR